MQWWQLRWLQLALQVLAISQLLHRTRWIKLEEEHLTHQIVIWLNPHLDSHSRKDKTLKDLIAWIGLIWTIKAQRDTFWKKILLMDSTRLRKDSLTWKRCKRWVRYQDRAAMRSRQQWDQLKQFNQPYQMDQLAWWSRDLTRSHLLVLEPSIDNNLVLLVKIALQQAQLFRKVQITERKTSLPSAAQCLKIQQAEKISEVTFLKTQTTLLLLRIWGPGPISSQNHHF